MRSLYIQALFRHIWDLDIVVPFDSEDVAMLSYRWGRSYKLQHMGRYTTTTTTTYEEVAHHQLGT